MVLFQFALCAEAVFDVFVLTKRIMSRSFNSLFALRRSSTDTETARADDPGFNSLFALRRSSTTSVPRPHSRSGFNSLFALRRSSTSGMRG